ncbi:Zn-dependent exopeptidase [Xylariaceae sp. FL0804]|nr:Zn-dependent exopeptidase [Xylariaceae sp. FL0804]
MARSCDTIYGALPAHETVSRARSVKQNNILSDQVFPFSVKMWTTVRLSVAAAIALHGLASAQLQVPLGSPGESGQDGLRHKHTKPLVNSEDIQAAISAESLVKHAESFYDIAKSSEEEYNHPTRVIGSQGHMGTLAYIKSAIKELGSYYKLSMQPFPAVMGKVYESRLVLGDQVPKSATAMSLTPPSSHKEPVHGNLVLVENDGCSRSDYPSGLEGNIAFVLRGACSFGAKSELAGRAGAKAAVVYNYDSDALSGTLGTPSKHHVATFGLSGDDAAPVLADLRAGKVVDSIAYIDSEVNTISTTNIVIQTTEGDPDNCVMLGAHSDSVGEGPGINDDGSGSMSLLEIAKQLTNFTVNNCVRFAWWAGEEEGLLGSDYYVDTLPSEENMKIRLFMDYDMLGSPNFAYQIYNATNAVNPVGSEQLRDLYVDWYEAHDLNYTFIPFDGRSDYDAFIRNGIPGGGIATGAEGIKTKEEQAMFGGRAGEWYDPCYHQLCDDVGNVNTTAWLLNTRLVAHSVATFATSFDGFPERAKAVSADAYGHQTKYHGRYLVV